MDVIVKGSPSIEIGFETKVIKVEGSIFDPSGKYPDLMAGDLVGRGESVPAEFSFRASGGKSIKDGTAWIKRLKGNSVVWNQKFAPRDITTAGIASTYQNGKYHSVGTSTNNYFNLGFFQSNELNHIYLFIVEGLSPSFSGRFSLLNRNSTVTINNGYAYIFHNNTDTSELRYIGFDQITVGEEIDETYSLVQYDLTQMFQAGNEPTTIEEFYARKPIVADEYAYNEGEVIHMTAEGIKSVGDNAWDEEWESGRYAPSTGLPNTDEGIRSKNRIKVLPNENYWCSAQNDIFAHFYDAEGNLITNVYSGQYNYLPIKGKQFTTPANAATMTFYVVGTTTYKNDILISLYHSGWKQDTDAGYQPYWQDRLIFDQRIKDEFPDGMKSAGTAHDVAYNDMNKGVGVTEKRIGVVDMGQANVSYDQTAGLFQFKPTGMMLPSTYAERMSGILCSRYAISNAAATASMPDKTMLRFSDGYIYIKDTTYTDAATFKAAMAGVMLYYQLAEPTIIEYDEPFNLDYKVADFGTEQAIAEQPSAPISADIIYQFNAVDMIREHEIEINELQSIIATMQAQLASLTSNNG